MIDSKDTVASSQLLTWLWTETRFKLVLVSLLLLIGISAAGARIYYFHQVPTRGDFDRSKQGYCDFHHGIYFASSALVRGISPYGQEFVETYPVPRPIPFFTPSVLLVHVPLAVLPKFLAEVIFFLLNLALILLLAHFAVRFSMLRYSALALMVVATVIVFSRAGHSTLFTGYFTYEIVVGTFLALHFGKTRPLLGGCGLFLAASKPTFAIPLAVLMAMRGHWKAAITGTVITTVVTALVVGWLLTNHSIGQLVEDVRIAQQLHHEDPNEMPVNSWVRIDLLAIVCKWLPANPGALVHLAIMLPLLLGPGLIVRQLTLRYDDQGAMGMAGLLACVTLLICIYHQFYDALIVILPCVGLIAGNSTWNRVSKPVRYTILLLAMAPAYNYLSAEMFLNRFVGSINVQYQVLTSISGVCLLAVFVMLIFAARRLQDDPIGQ